MPEYTLTIRKVIILLDEEDSDLLRLTWHITKPGYIARGNKTDEGYKTQFIHRVILERSVGRALGSDEFTDHINGNRLDNRRSNLRVVNKLQNCRNAGRYKNNTSGYKGVGWDKKVNKWRARIRINGRLTKLGWFKTPEEAYAAYCEAARQHFGEYARLEDKP